MGNQWVDLVPRNTLLEYYKTIITSNNGYGNYRYYISCDTSEY